VLIDDLMTAVPSFLGLTMTIPPACGDGDWVGVTLNLLPPILAESVNTTVLVPLNALGISGPGGSVVFYAARPGAFVDLAADTRFAYGLNGQVALDQHLPSPDKPLGRSGVFGRAEAGSINRAIGVLMGRGHTPEKPATRCNAAPTRMGFPCAASLNNCCTQPSGAQSTDSPAGGRPGPSSTAPP
jgi:hypothetical protein